ncbi:alpha-galactosidase [candidate division KSB1 bacterium]|nr:alpha-galactosidase [candidate division KSB1 bacterium]
MIITTSGALFENASAAKHLCELPLYSDTRNDDDWLVEPVHLKAGIFRSENSNEILLSNGLIRRTFRLAPNAATVGYDNLMTGETIIRGIKPEALVKLDGVEYAVGGLMGQIEYGYLLSEWLDSMSTDPQAFQFAGFETGKTSERFHWHRKRYAADLPFPPTGVSLRLDFKPPRNKLAGIELSIHYEMNDGIPLLCKWVTIQNKSERPIQLNTITTEILAAVEYESSVGNPEQWIYPNIHVESDYAFYGMLPRNADKTTHWVPDPQYTSQINYRLDAPLMLESRPPIGPDVMILPGDHFESFRTYELIYDTTERERKGLALRRMYRTIAPWVTENPILMHVRNADDASVRLAIDQCAEVGFEMVIMTFGSGFDIEDDNPETLKRYKTLADYAHSKGIELGGYSLLASRKISPEHDVINPKTGKTGDAIFDNSPCLCSAWGEAYFKKLFHFYEQTGMDVLEHDGSYPGDLCASIRHPGHRNLDDSQWMQWKKITHFYNWCRGKGIYLNVPDWYFLNGSNKNGMGYREVNWSLPRERQILLARQNIYDGTWQKTSSMGWMFVPLVEYHGGGSGATLEPLSEHPNEYGAHLAQNFGSGVQACYRGPRLYDSPETKALVKKWVDFYKKYRPILDSDIIHVRRPDGRDIDCILHANPFLKHKGLAMVYNPLKKSANRKLKLPLYYCGLTDVAKVSKQGAAAITYKLDRSYAIELNVEMEAKSVTWFVIE